MEDVHHMLEVVKQKIMVAEIGMIAAIRETREALEELEDALKPKPGE